MLFSVMPLCEVYTGRVSSAGVSTARSSRLPSSSTKYETGRPSAPAIFSSVVMVGTIPPCSILWIAAADTSERSPSCCSDSPRLLRRLNTFSPIELTMRSRSSAASSPRPVDCASRQGGPCVRTTRFMGIPLVRTGRPILTSLKATASIVYEASRILNDRSPTLTGRAMVTQRIVVIGGGAAGIGAAGAAKATDPAADVRVYTEFEDVEYSPCGIPYVHGKEIPDFERLFLATKEAYAGQGIDIHYERRVTGFSP